MHEIESWIEEAVQGLKIFIRKLPEKDAIEIQQKVTSRYVKRDSPCAWWQNLKKPIDEFYNRNSVPLAAITPSKSGPCWLIPDTEGKWLPVYDVNVEDVGKLIDNCPGFEYYVVARDLSWLIVETHHDQYYVCRESDQLPELFRGT